MEDVLAYIDRYFQGEMPEEEKAAFARRCETDMAFAEAVSFYVAARQSVRATLLEQKRKTFDELYQQLSAGVVKPQSRIRQWLLYAAAACLLVLIGWLLLQPPSPRQLAERYIDRELKVLPVTMGRQDSLQLGIAAFNRQEFITAEQIFLSLCRQGTQAAEARKHLGLIYLVTGEYDKALRQFDTLSAHQGLYANPGPFYKAVTLMRRSAGNDKEEARKILQAIIEQRLPGSQTAEAWIRHF
ncbi:tetratricopeptide repeat protein [Chitinophaga japonensis]|uniref:Tetratricopeptide repeat protein n=1 Tax=Chitinophaga japonensis TaxID=104662 RepID=A0A562T185_CHIJA|nr:hypothetical protein [Chitinophaga japonensis]TWI86968.1 hypothetical protein LX66_4235 [Chitinophaga japonensis]